MKKRILHTILIGLGILFLPVQVGVSSAAGVETKFAGKIIRSLSVDGARVLVGLKGGKPGTALVYESQDGGKSWRGLNGGSSLSAQATDVQAVAAIGNVIFAGTWKHGLFISRDGGGAFKNEADFPSSDIRSFRVVGTGAEQAIYAATARDGVFRSGDAGATWVKLGPGRDFFWSLTAGEMYLYAVSLEKAVYRRAFKAPSWRKIFDQDDAYSLASAPGGNRLAIAAQTGGYRSSDGGASWQRLALPGREKLSSVLYLNNGSALFGSWSNGVIRVESGAGAVHRYLQKTAVLHLALSGETLFVATWGAGLKVIPLDAVLK